MSYNCEILADSKNPQGDRITTMKITFPRFILAEFNTHRMFSRNSASSRAIPFKKMVKMVEENPFIPIAWQKDHKGMQGTEYYSNKYYIDEYNHKWLLARDKAVDIARSMNKPGDENSGVTKQLCNRLLEPFIYHTVIVTSTEWENFFKLRCPQYSLFSENLPMSFRSKKDLLKYVKQVEAPEFKNDYDNLTDLEWVQCNESQAEIHIQAIAELMWDAYNESTPKQLQAGEWHVPFSDKIDIEKLLLEVPILDEEEEIEKAKIKIATARCARISYQTLGDNPKVDYNADIKLHDTLSKMQHWSPFEHIAQVMTLSEYHERYATHPCNDKGNGWSRNFKGFIQYRSLIDKK